MKNNVENIIFPFSDEKLTKEQVILRAMWAYKYAPHLFPHKTSRYKRDPSRKGHALSYDLDNAYAAWLDEALVELGFMLVSHLKAKIVEVDSGYVCIIDEHYAFGKRSTEAGVRASLVKFEAEWDSVPENAVPRKTRNFWRRGKVQL